MKPRKDVNSGDSALTLRNTMWALPYLAVMGVSLGYAAGGLSGALIGLLAAVVIAAAVGSATTVFTGMLGGRAVDILYGMGRRTISLRERLAGDLNVAKHHKLCGRFDESLLKIEEILAKDPVFPEALFVKAQILWQGFEDREAAKACLLNIIKVKPDKNDVFHRWASGFYRELSNGVQARSSFDLY